MRLRFVIGEVKIYILSYEFASNDQILYVYIYSG